MDTRGSVIRGLLVLLCLLCAWSAAAEGAKLTVTQTLVRLPVITTYLEISDATDQPVSNLQISDFSATLKGVSLKVLDAVPLDHNKEGVAYVFLLDVSGSVGRQFAQMREAVAAWIESLKASDRMAIYTFGEAVREVTQFTADKQTLRAALDSLRPKGAETLLYVGLQNAIKAASLGSDSGLPGRRVVIVLTDGKDEGSGITADEVQKQISESRLPLFAIGSSSLPAGERNQYLGELRRLADASGGMYLDAAASQMPAAYQVLQRAIERVFVVKLACDNCRPDSQGYPMQMNLKAAGLPLLTDSVLLPLLPPAPPVTPSTPWWVYGGVVLVVVGVTIGVIVYVMRKEKDQIPPIPPPLPTPPPVRPPPNRRITLAVVRGKNSGQVHQIDLADRAVIGRAPECNLVLANDERVSSLHCELVFVERRVALKDLQSTNGTILNGVPVAGLQRLETGDVIGIGGTEFRISITKP